jgi:hypothetical protein
MLTGHCLCGDVRFEISGGLGPIIYCHCSRCRRASGSAFATNASVRMDEFRVVAGQDQVTEYESRPGSFRGFCSRCGSPVYVRHAERGVTRVRLGTIDGDPGARPVAHIWTGSKAAWDDSVVGLEQFEEAPPIRYVAPSAPGGGSR